MLERSTVCKQQRWHQSGKVTGQDLGQLSITYCTMSRSLGMEVAYKVTSVTMKDEGWKW